jgi:hypothetical protein
LVFDLAQSAGVLGEEGTSAGDLLLGAPAAGAVSPSAAVAHRSRLRRHLEGSPVRVSTREETLLDLLDYPVGSPDSSLVS